MSLSAVQSSRPTPVKQIIAEAAPSLLPPLVNLVSEYLFPKPEGWITEWTGQHGYEVLTEALNAAETPLTHGPASLVVQYLQKSDIFGLAQLEQAAHKNHLLGRGSEKALTNLIGDYNPEQPLPLEIDDEMQKDLSQLFNEETLAGIPDNIKKVTELYSLYWCPKGMSACRADCIHPGRGFDNNSSTYAVRAAHGRTESSADSWIQFPNHILGRNKLFEEEQALTPIGYDIPQLSDALFCIFLKQAATETILLSTTYTFCRERVPGGQVLIGAYVMTGQEAGLQLCIGGQGTGHGAYGVSFVRKFSQDRI